MTTVPERKRNLNARRIPARKPQTDEREPKAFFAVKTVAHVVNRRPAPAAAALAALLLGRAAAAGASSEHVPLRVSDGATNAPSARVSVSAACPGETSFYLHAPTSRWVELSAVEMDVFWPAHAPTNAQVLFHVKDWDYRWYQNLLPGYLQPARTNRFRVSFASPSEAWIPVGHHAAWHLRALAAPDEVGFRILCRGSARGVTAEVEVAGLRRAYRDPPSIRAVQANAVSVPRYGLFQATFELPDRYADPFDASEVHVRAHVETPDGRTNRVEGFYARSYFRVPGENGERIEAQGRPYWRIRYPPDVTGRHRYTLVVEDRAGAARWGPGAFNVVPSQAPGFVRVSRTDPRFFEFDDGAFYFPIGHNTRSPFDTRMDSRFPWRKRWPEGSDAYARYFRDMQRSGENWAEVWTAPWSLGLEWSTNHPGYHGVGEFNLEHAWELDQVMDLAERHEIYVNLIIHNHGKFSAFSDPEWRFNPFNASNGGYLSSPNEYFTDERARASFRKLMRYMIARWGYSRRIFAWGLWSELDLVGASRDLYRQPEVAAWHREMSAFVKETDPFDHLVSTHVCGDYTHMNPDLLTLPDIDVIAGDAYHGSGDPLHIVALLTGTAQFANPFYKPVLITEFGGSHLGHSVAHLRQGLHAALWSSGVLPLGGTPMFWWWQVVEEEDFYPLYAAFSRFMQNEDRRDPSLLMGQAVLLADDVPLPNMRCLTFKNERRGAGWIYDAARFQSLDPSDTPDMTNLVLRLDGMTNGTFRAEFWDTSAGVPVGAVRAASSAGNLRLPVPPFARDIAFKLFRE